MTAFPDTFPIIRFHHAMHHRTVPHIAMAVLVSLITLNPRQSLAELTLVTARGDSILDRLATITTDTGAFFPGHTSFPRYTVPSLCLAAAHNTLDVVQGTIAVRTHLDTIRM